MKVSTGSMTGSPWTIMTFSSSGCLMFTSEANEIRSNIPSLPQIFSCGSTRMALWSQVRSMSYFRGLLHDSSCHFNTSSSTCKICLTWTIFGKRVVSFGCKGESISHLLRVQFLFQRGILRNFTPPPHTPAQPQTEFGWEIGWKIFYFIHVLNSLPPRFKLLIFTYSFVVDIVTNTIEFFTLGLSDAFLSDYLTDLKVHSTK